MRNSGRFSHLDLSRIRTAITQCQSDTEAVAEPKQEPETATGTDHEPTRASACLEAEEEQKQEQNQKLVLVQTQIQQGHYRYRHRLVLAAIGQPWRGTTERLKPLRGTDVGHGSNRVEYLWPFVSIGQPGNRCGHSWTIGQRGPRLIVAND